MHTRIVFGSGTDTMRWAWTEGLRDYGQAEIAVPITWDHGNWRDDQVRDLLEGFDMYVRTQPKRISADQHMQHFWTVLCFRASTPADVGLRPGMLVVQELADPLHDVEPSFTDGAQRAILLLMHQRHTAHRAGLDEAIDPPYAWMSAELCRRVNPHGGSALRLQRRSPKWESTEPGAGDSGWLIACADPAHAHDEPGATVSTHLMHVVEHYPHTFPYLALPVGSQVHIDGEAITILRPGEATPLHDTQRPFTGFK